MTEHAFFFFSLMRLWFAVEIHCILMWAKRGRRKCTQQMLGRLLLQGMNFHHHAGFGWVIFFLVAGRILCFGSMMEIVLITQDYRTADWVSLERTYKLMFELLLSSHYKSRNFQLLTPFYQWGGWGCTRSCDHDSEMEIWPKQAKGIWHHAQYSN